MRFAIVGLGFISPRHIEAIENIGGEIILTCDIDPNKKADFLNYKEMFNSPKFDLVDYVIVCTPNWTHTEISRLATSKGKRVLCEKPLTILGDYDNLENVNVVHQFRYHPKLHLMNSLLKEDNQIEMGMSVYRDEDYWNSWKGDESKSGGLLYVLGSHLFDLAIHLLGDDYEIIEAHNKPRFHSGRIKFPKGIASYRIEALPTREGQKRYFNINGKEIVLSTKDNLSFEGLHTRVYENLIESNGLKAEEAVKCLKLIEKLKTWSPHYQ